MFEQVKSAAGIHMSTFKSSKETSEDVAAKDGSNPEDLDLSGWTPMPSQMLAWRKPV